jgi:hypothetical protein
MSVDTTGTVLEFSGPGVPLYSSRFATQTLEPIGQAAANLYRDVNGDLHAPENEAFQKYRSRISCSDMWPMALDGIWPGQLITVDCACYLGYKTSGGSPSRSVVAGSSQVVGDHTFYRPQLSMMVISLSSSEDEIRKDAGWVMELEEI